MEGKDSELTALLKEFGKELPQKVDALLKEWQNLRKHWDKESLQIFHKHIHNFCGTTGSYGYIEISKASHKLELYLTLLNEQNVLFTPEIDRMIDYLFDEIKKCLPK